MAKKWELTLGDDINTFIFLDGCEGIDVANDESARIGSVQGGEGKVGEDPGGDGMGTITKRRVYLRYCCHVLFV